MIGYPQKCGDVLVILEETSKRNSYLVKLFRCKFQKYSYEVLATRKDIISGEVINKKLPWYSGDNLSNYIKDNFDKKPNIDELSIKINKSDIIKYIKKFHLESLIEFKIF